MTGDQLAAVVDFIHASLGQPITLGDLAAVARVSRFHFARLFKRATGLPPHRYVIERRVERAKQLITEGRLTLAQVAADVGFADQSHLSRHFKGAVGVTPGRYS